ncbi:MAG: iron-containing alcohol dehydrogenase [Phycisphaerales bacterium]|nr:iron-containing alcohol dehydrogenase [Phycisphaerales bacterium]
MPSMNGVARPAIPGSRVEVVVGPGALDHLPDLVRRHGGTRVLLVTDPGIKDAGHVERAVRALYQAGLPVKVFDAVGENPTIIHVGRGVIASKPFEPDLIVGLGGGSAMDCGKGINFILTNGGRVADYWGHDKAAKPLLPFIAVPTTAGTGSDAQSYALITDPDTHQKMACGDKSALPRAAVLDPDLTATAPPKVAAATGIDAVAHAVESAGSTKRTDVSRALSKQAWTLLEPAFGRVTRDPADAAARQDMLLGAHVAGAAIENSMLGAAHALANPLTGLCGVVHGVAVGLMLPHVVRFNAAGGGTGTHPYADLAADAEDLARRIEVLLDAGGLPRTLAAVDVPPAKLPELAAMAAKQWTAQFNPRPVGEAELLAIYRMAAAASSNA